jgi:glycerol-3-phosphate O-acyltransferase
MLDDITQAVLARDDVARYLKADTGQTARQARERIFAYLDELRTTQRYPLYRALKHPLYPILRKVERIYERMDIVREATSAGRVIYVSNHRSHLDYLVEPLALEDHKIRPPVIAAGINLFGGPLGLLHRHVTGAIPIRRDAKDPAYLVTLKAYVSELLQRRDLLFYLEGGRSYSGEMKSPKTGLLHAALQADNRDEIVVLPAAVSYDVVLEDAILARQGAKRRQRPFSREVVEMVGAAVGYQSRAFVTFGAPIPLAGWDHESRRDVMTLAYTIRDAIGRLFKVVPSSIVASVVRPSIPAAEVRRRVAGMVETLQAAGANLDATDPAMVAERGLQALEQRGVLVRERDLWRVRERLVLRYYARAITHLLVQSKRAAPAPRTS